EPGQHLLHRYDDPSHPPSSPSCDPRDRLDLLRTHLSPCGPRRGVSPVDRGQHTDTDENDDDRERKAWLVDERRHDANHDQDREPEDEPPSSPHDVQNAPPVVLGAARHTHARLARPAPPTTSDLPEVMSPRALA